MLKKFFLFLLLSVWIIFLSLVANVFYAPSVLTQSDAAYKCRSATEKTSSGKIVGTYFYKSGAGLQVLIERDSFPYLSDCLFDDKMELLRVF